MSLVCISPIFSVTDTIDWYINRFCLSWTILVGISIGFVCRGQYWLVYLPVLSVVYNNGWYITLICLSLTILVCISRSLSFLNNIGWHINRFCLSWTIMVGLSPKFVCHGQYWLLYLPVLSVVDNNGWYINVGISHGFVDNNDWYSSVFFLSWTIMVGISTGFVCLGQ